MTRVADLEIAVSVDPNRAGERGLRNLNQNLERSGSIARGATATAFGFLGAQITMHAASSARAMLSLGMDTETAMNVFQSVTESSAEQMKEVSALAKQLGNDLTLPAVSAKDATFAMTEMAKAGMSVKDTMAAAKGTLQLSTAANVDAGRAAQITANALNAFKLPGTQAGRVADLLAGAANSASGEITDMADALKMSSAVFAASGQGIDDLTTAIALMANQGIIGSDAGTSLKSMMLALQSPSKPAAAAMAELGMKIYDANGKMLPFRDIIIELQDSIKGLTQEQRDFALGTIFGSDAIRSANVLIAEGTTGFDKMKESVTQAGSAARVSEARMKGLRGAIEGLKSQIETQMLSTYDKISPALEKVVRTISNNFVPAMAAISDAWTSVTRPAVDAFKDAIVWLQQNPLFASAAIGAIAGAFTYLLVPALVMAAAAAWAFIAPLIAAAAPFLLIGAAMGALAGAFVYAYNNFTAFRVIVDQGVAKVVEAFNWLKDVAADVMDWWREMWPGVSEEAQKAWDKLQPLLNHMKELFVSTFEVIKAIIEKTVEIIKNLWARFGDDLIARTKAIFSAIVGFVKGAFASIVETLNGLVQIITGIFDLIKAILTGKWGEAWDAILKILSGAIDMIVGLFHLLMDSIVFILKAGFQLVLTVIQAAMALISAIWSAGWNMIKTFVSDIWQNIYKFLSAIGETIIGVIDGMIEKVKMVWSVGWNSVKAFFEGIWGGFTGFVVRTFDSIVETVRGMPGRISSAASGMWDGLKEAFKAAFNWIIEKWNGLDFTLPKIEAFGYSIGGETFGTPNITPFADGGIVTKPTLALIGERFETEYVVPERKADRFALERLGNMSGGQKTTIVTQNWNVDITQQPGESAEDLVAKLRQYARENSNDWMLSPV